jgi:Zn-dependent metalloprotease
MTGITAYNKRFRLLFFTASLSLLAPPAQTTVFGAGANFMAAPTQAVWGQPTIGEPSRVDPSTGAVAVADSLGRIAGQHSLSSFGASSSPAPASANRHGIQLLRTRAGEDVKVQFRSNNRTVMQIRGRILEPASSGLAPASLAGLPHRTALNFLQSNRALLGLVDPSQEVQLESQDREDSGQRHLRFTQTFQGLPVWPTSLTVHLNAQGHVTLFDGAYVPTPADVSILPAIDEAGAIEYARACVSGGAQGEVRDAALVVYAPLAQDPRLAWKLQLTVDFAHAWSIVVDAQNGRILSRNNRCLDANVSSSAKDLAGKNATFNVWSANSRFSMADTTKPMFNPAFDPIQDPHGVISIFDAREVTDKDLKTVYLVDSATAADWIPDAVSALVNFDATFDYYLDRHTRSSLDGNGGNVQAVVRIAQLDNAFWNGDAKMMFFGNVLPYPLALDVVGHELTHGVTQNSADLIYELQPGAMNEAFSDIFGEMVEARTYGQPDWVLGKQLGKVFRDFINPGTIKFGSKPMPAKMSEYIDLPNDSNNDHGGVHENSSIINHAYYMLAAGLPDAIGLRDAEKIFYRCLTKHLQKQSQFIDARLGCVASAEEIFGPGAAQIKVVEEAFDAVEIFDKPATPPPSPIPVVEGPDATLFVSYDPSVGEIALGRYEIAKNDPQGGIALVESVQSSRPAVTGDGRFALFVDSAYDLCGVSTDDPNSLECTGFQGYVHSVAVSPDSRLFAFVLRDPVTGKPQNQINVFDYVKNTTASFKLVAPVLDSTPVNSVLYADSMVFTADSKQLIYDALTELKFGNGTAVQRWSIFRLNLASETTTVLVPPQEGADFGNPSIGRAGNRYLAFDARSTTTDKNAIVVLDLFTGDAGIVGLIEGSVGYPCFNGDESAVIYAAPDPVGTWTGFSLFKQSLTADRLGTNGPPSLWLKDATVGVTYRRGVYVSTNALPAVALTSPANGAVFTPSASITLTATASDADGTVSKVEFFEGSDIIGESLSSPFRFIWSGAPSGAHRLIARAIDNLGGSTDSDAVAITVGQAGGSVKLFATLNPNHTLNVTVKGSPGGYTLQQSTDLIRWTDLVPFTIDATGTVAVNPSGVPAKNQGLFYRVRSQ